MRGFDFHEPSVQAARTNAANLGLSDRVQFEAVSSTKYEGSYDLICFFDCLHDMGDPVGIARHAREHLTPGGTVLLVEPFALSNTGQTTSPVIPLPGSSTMPPPSSAPPARSPKTLGAAWAPNQANPACGPCSTRQASPTSALRTLHRSTSSTKRALSHTATPNRPATPPRAERTHCPVRATRDISTR